MILCSYVVSIIRKIINGGLFRKMINIINRKTLLEYCRKYLQAAVALQEWYYELLRAKFRNFNELKKEYASVSMWAMTELYSILSVVNTDW